MSMILGRCYRWCYRLICWAIIAVAIALLLLNIATRALISFDDKLVGWLQDSLGMPVSATIESSRWRGMLPEFTVANAALGEGEYALRVDQVVGKPDLIRSMLSRSVVWRDLYLRDIELSLVEQPGGRWQIAGIDLVSDQGGDQATVIEKMLLGSRQIKLMDIDARLQFSSGTEIRMHVDSAQIENSFGYHRLVANAEVNQELNQLDLIIELTGLSNRFSDLDGQGYISFQGRDLTDILTILIGRYTDTTLELGSQPAVTGQIWANVHSGSRAEFQGYLEVQDMPGQIFSSELENLYFRSDIAGEFHYYEDKLWLDFVRPDLLSAEKSWPLNDFRLTRESGLGNSIYSAQLEELDLASLSERLDELYELPSALSDALRDLSPSGFLRNLEVSLDSGEPKDSFSFFADLDGVSIDYFKRAPAVRNLSGALTANAQGGIVEVNASDVSIHYPMVYDWWLDHDSVKGTVGWELNLDEKRIKIFGRDMVVNALQGLVHGDFMVDSSMVPTEQGMDFYLYAGLQNSSAEHWPTLVPSKLPQSLRDWLQSAELKGQVPAGALVYRGKVKPEYSQYRSMQLRLRAEDANMRYLGSWPRAEKVQAEAFVSNALVSVSAETASLPGIALQDVNVRVNASPSVKSLTVSASGEGETNALLDLVRQTSLREKVGDGLDSLEFEGYSEVSATVTMPLKNNPDESEIDVTVRASLTDNGLHLTEQNLILSELSGDLNYGTSGLNAEKLRASLWDKSLDISIEEVPDQSLINVRANGDVDVVSIADWLELDFMRYLTGIANADMLLQLSTDSSSDQPNRYLFASDMVGVGLDLPGGLSKLPDEETLLMLTIESGDQQTLELEWSEGLNLSLRKPNDGSLPEGRYASGTFALNANLPTHQSGKFIGRIYQPEIDVDQWLDALMLGDVSTNAEQGKLLGLIPEIGISTRRLVLGGTEYGLVESSLSSNDEGWQVGFQNSFAEGAYLYPYAPDSMPKIHFEYLDIDTYGHFLEENTVVGQAQSVDPRGIPSLDVFIDDLRMGEMSKGGWSAQLRSSSAGLNIEDIRCEFGSLVCGTETQGSALFWGMDDEGEYSALNLTLSFDDISDMFGVAGIKSPMTSESGQFYASINWGAAPHKMRDVPAFGVMGVDVTDGEFHAQAAGVGAGIIRLVGLVNVDTWMRRLKLDFSDVAAGGTPYDSLVGDFTLNQNVLTTLTPVNVDLPSGRMLLDGAVNLDESDVDARLVVTLPARQNMTWIAALAGGLPAAAGVWVVGQIFDDELDNLASVSYQVTGGLDAPEIKTERIFDATVEQ